MLYATFKTQGMEGCGGLSLPPALLPQVSQDGDGAVVLSVPEVMMTILGRIVEK